MHPLRENNHPGEGILEVHCKNYRIYRKIQVDEEVNLHVDFVSLHLMDSFFFENLCLGNHDVVLVTLPVWDWDVVCWEVLTFDDPGRTG
jgi:hypothetical protein